MTLPRASVLMTVHNGQEDIERALQGALSQTGGPYEVVVVDDGSTDQTPTILVRYAFQHSNLRVVRCDHVGRAKALNIGLAQCRGAYIAINDCDDVSTPNRLQTQIQYLDEHHEAVLVAGWARVIEDGARVLGERRLPSEDSRLRRRLAIGNPFVHSTIMYRKDALQRVGGFDESRAAGVDYDVIERLARLGTLACVPTVVGLHGRSDRQFFRVGMRRSDRWRAAATVAVRAAFRHAFWMLPISLFIYAATRIPISDSLLEGIQAFHSRIVRGGPV